MTDPTRLLAHEMAALLRSGEASSRELTEVAARLIARAPEVRLADGFREIIDGISV